MSRSRRTLVGSSIVVAIIAAGALAGVWRGSAGQAERAPQYKGCHDPFRLVSRSAGGVPSRLNTVLMITPPEWPDLQAFFRNYTKQHDWSDRDLSKTVPGSYQRIYVDICSEHFNISVNLILWDDHPPYTDFLEKQVDMGLYTNAPQEQWHAVAREFVQALEARWPGRVKFKSGSGTFIEPPGYLNLH